MVRKKWKPQNKNFSNNQWNREKDDDGGRWDWGWALIFFCLNNVYRVAVFFYYPFLSLPSAVSTCSFQTTCRQKMREVYKHWIQGTFCLNIFLYKDFHALTLFKYQVKYSECRYIKTLSLYHISPSLCLFLPLSNNKPREMSLLFFAFRFFESTPSFVLDQKPEFHCSSFFPLHFWFNENLMIFVHKFVMRTKALFFSLWICISSLTKQTEEALNSIYILHCSHTVKSIRAVR